ncbi:MULTISPECIES: NADH-quinone oxidoreductase subunit C [Clostridium]|uniref:NADH-quinone oxidoreductase n=2 Tax=Clostridium beijerinckii TaxID=1520 RepID=A0AAW3W6L3_CLOBE|nr:NADH-quinone oxidoreductase subunit C [Clostridium beijerinckii]ALB45825.1 NADH-quinone oxidoreductase subunit C [Clostridium beijerinckii NRRL B-598]MBC2457378.1 NADH-quinone oxidoreductase subunit C [Clostridium beijerinckii]MBC2474478.1 NADH-quinone oxidoreductase subunit C [Clostridium beijerinckii]NOV60600.1 NADH-quinone oxidoreductase subunit C [Clostridium beijerinckii]NOV70626.1 NADH-quinone oxidoreductase subunit C [Clostridium beijerinckii]
MSKTCENLIFELKAEYKQDIEIIENTQIAIHTEASKFLDVIKKVKQYGFDFLVDLTAIEDDVLSCIYHFMSLNTHEMIRIKVKLNEKLEIPSLTKYWLAANVQEREAYDLFGINFIGHPDLKRILCPDDFLGHPLRKDFKVEKRR